MISSSSSGPGVGRTARSRLVALVAAFLGWLCAGFLMSTTSVAMQPAATALLGQTGALDPVRFQELTTRAQAAKTRPASSPGLTADEKAQLGQWRSLVQGWFAWLQCAFLFGAAAGGLLFGRLGDRVGRVKGMGASILTYSLLAGAASQAQEPWHLLCLWFCACLGVGGMWPNGVALVSEAWSSLSRPVAAGLIG
ncbi:MAG: MFS transporter, partial [Armatimonadetes bacterium]|nr:MFS transporter [Armatimonadota bacterium]